MVPSSAELGSGGPVDGNIDFIEANDGGFYIVLKDTQPPVNPNTKFWVKLDHPNYNVICSMVFVAYAQKRPIHFDTYTSNIEPFPRINYALLKTS